MPAVFTFCLLILTAKVSKYLYELLDADDTSVWKVAESLWCNLFLSFASGCHQSSEFSREIWNKIAYVIVLSKVVQKKTFVWAFVSVYTSIKEKLDCSPVLK